MESKALNNRNCCHDEKFASENVSYKRARWLLMPPNKLTPGGVFFDPGNVTRRMTAFCPVAGG